MLNFDISKSSSDVCSREQKTTKKECAALLKEDEKEDGLECCLVKGQQNGEDISECHLYIEENYLNKDGFVQYLQDYEKIANPKVECKSYYLQLTLLSLILILL